MRDPPREACFQTPHVGLDTLFTTAQEMGQFTSINVPIVIILYALHLDHDNLRTILAINILFSKLHIR